MKTMSPADTEKHRHFYKYAVVQTLLLKRFHRRFPEVGVELRQNQVRQRRLKPVETRVNSTRFQRLKINCG